jgi:hypothetical protein
VEVVNLGDALVELGRAAAGGCVRKADGGLRCITGDFACCPAGESDPPTAVSPVVKSGSVIRDGQSPTADVAAARSDCAIREGEFPGAVIGGVRSVCTTTEILGPAAAGRRVLESLPTSNVPVRIPYLPCLTGCGVVDGCPSPSVVNLG